MKRFWSIFALVGLPFFALGLFFGYADARVVKNGLRVEGQVVALVHDGKGATAPTLVYTTRDQVTVRWTSNIYSKPSVYAVGDKVQLFYDVRNPQKVVIDAWADRWLFPLAFGGLGSIFLLLGLGGLFKIWRADQMALALQQFGLPIMANLKTIQWDTHIRMNGKMPWRAVAEWRNPKDDRVYTFKSVRIFGNPVQKFGKTSFSETDQVEVFVDPSNPQKYWMNLSF